MYEQSTCLPSGKARSNFYLRQAIFHLRPVIMIEMTQRWLPLPSRLFLTGNGPAGAPAISFRMFDRLRSSTPPVSPTGDPRVLLIDSNVADDVLGAMASTTARQILGLLHEEPCPPSAIADRLDLSIPNVHYHLENLEDAGLIAVVDIWYSEKGNEMQVYAPADGPIVFVGTEDRVSPIRALLRRLIGALGLLALGSVLVQRFVKTILFPQEQSVVSKVPAAGSPDRIAFTPIPPGLLFFAGGICILALGVAWWYWDRQE